MTWEQQLSVAIEAMEADTATDAGKKAFYSGDGVARAKAIVKSIDQLKRRIERFVRA